MIDHDQVLALADRLQCMLLDVHWYRQMALLEARVMIVLV